MKKPDSRFAAKPSRQDVIKRLKKLELVYSLRGKFRGKGLLEELIAEKAREREL